MQSLARRLEQGGALSCAGVSRAAQPFLAALVRHLFPERPLLVVTEGLKTQESFLQDITTWTSTLGPEPGEAPARTAPPSQLLFYPSWENLPHEDRRPHVDVIAERLETLVALARYDSRPGSAPLIVTSVAALLQRTFPRERLQQQTRSLSRGERVDPLDLVEWLEGLGYEPEAQVTQKGELALRGGILDLYPVTSPWPVRLEFFGDELESLRHFDPLTQISREEITTVTIPPAGELGLLKKLPPADSSGKKASADGDSGMRGLATLLDYLPPQTVLLLCEPDQLDERAREYAAQVPAADRFFIDWADFQSQALVCGLTQLSVTELEQTQGQQDLPQERLELSIQSLDPF
ncbi:MAG: hypothetical protein EHM39_12150, partial [Chloroflexi bacterium]